MKELLKEINEYLESKIPEVKESTRDEISTYIVCRFVLREADIINRINMELERSLLSARLDSFQKDIIRTSIYPYIKKGEE